MTFRGRLRVFFAIIVIVPMVAIGLALLSITASSERGKTDAGLATASLWPSRPTTRAARGSRRAAPRGARPRLTAALAAAIGARRRGG